MEKKELVLTLKDGVQVQKSFICISESSLKKMQENFLNILSSEEQKNFQKMIGQKRQHHYLLGRYSSKKALGHICSMPMEDIYIESGFFCQPVIMKPRDIFFQVSLSHTDNLAAAIVFPETHPMGIDVEEISYKNNSAILSQMTKQEMDILNGGDIPFSLTVVWTAKEALSKVLRCGLMVPFSLLEISNYQKKK
jgi:4'-phosphopantetheinyl transferase